jgi:hypothetical protein
MGIDYPLAIDNDFAVWRAFDNHYWPALYFADAEGRIRHHRFGEEDYERSERVIQQLLREAGRDPEQRLVEVEPGGVEAAADWSTLESPETYVGYARTEGFASPGGLVRDQSHVYEARPQLELNQWALSGDWTVGDQPTGLNEADGRISHRFHARDVNLVMGSDGSARFRVTLDGEPPGPAAGLDVDQDGSGTVAEARLYQLIRQDGRISDRTFEITFLDPGVTAYVFAFG